jgi:hypothetical protein
MSLFYELLGKHHGHARHSGHHDDQHRFGEPHGWDNGHDRRDQHHGWGGDHRPSHGHARSFPHAAPLLMQAMRSKSVIIGLALFAAVFLVAAIAVLVYLLPFISQQIGFVGETGIKGVLDKFAPILNLLWNGAGK